MSKFRMYIDESGNSDMGSSAGENNRYLCLTGVVFDLEYVENYLKEDLKKFKQKYFGGTKNNRVILHRKDIMNYIGPFAVLKDNKLKERYNKELLAKLKEWDYTLITVLIDKKEQLNMYHSWLWHPYHYCMEILIERFCTFLQDRQSTGDILIESRNKIDDRKLQNTYNKFYREGTHFVCQEVIRECLTSSQIKIKKKSDDIAGLQIADLLVTPLRNKILIDKGKRERTLQMTFNDLIAKTVDSKIFKHNNKLWGYGLKILP